MGDVEWTKERMARLRRLCANKQLSFSDIARTLSKEFGIPVPRNGCIGKAHRMGIKRRPAPGRKLPHRQPSEPVAEPIPMIMPRWRVEFADPRPDLGRGRVTIQQLEPNMCRWPYGDRVPYLFCGEATAGKTYCAYHTGISCGMRMARDRVMA